MLDLAYESLAAMLQGLGLDRARRAGRALGFLMWYGLPERRRLALESVEDHLEARGAQARRLARESFDHAGQSFLELLFTRCIDHRFMAERIELPDPECFSRHIQADRPLVAVTGHIGAWELLAGLLNLHARSRPAQIVVRQPKDETLSRIMTRFRQGSSVEVVHRDRVTGKVLTNLKHHGITAFLVDQNTGRSKAVFLPFLGQYAAVNMGPALLAIRARAVVWPICLVRLKNGGYRLETQAPLDTRDLSAPSLKEKVEQVAAFYTRAVEAMVRAYPEQWFWMHRRWKKRPSWEA